MLTLVLTGTPVQNDLGEYWAMVGITSATKLTSSADFACPGVFGTYLAFSRQFEKPILKARNPKCSKGDAETGLEKSTEVRSPCWASAHSQLKDLSLEFVLRRTSEVLNDFLPPKSTLACEQC